MENTTIQDLANYLLTKESMTHLKLQKLCYYCVAWNLVLNGSKKLLKEEDCVFEAWVHGPVSRSLYESTEEASLEFIPQIALTKDIEDKFTAKEKKIIDMVWDTYSEFPGDHLESITHSETPWLEQREGLGKFESSSNKISFDTMENYYKEIYNEEEK